ncbi:MAG: SpoIIE family protein phosphatase [bacterium]|nr:SpoIIE family protein phosphatase [bacterium]
MQTRAQKAHQLDRYKSEVSETLHRINRLVIPPYLLLISYLAFFADHVNYPQFSEDMFVGRFVSMATSAIALTISIMAGWRPILQRIGSFTGILTMCGVAFMITHFAAVMQNHFSAQTAWIVGNIIIGGLYPVSFAWSAGILAVSYIYYLGVYLGIKQSPIDLQFQMTLLNSGIAGVTALAIKYGFIVIRKREFFSRVRLEQANQQIALLNDQLKDENLRMSHELDVARKIQHIVLPSGEEYRDFADLDIACVMVTADEVGGDYYDIIRFDDRGGALNGSHAEAAKINSESHAQANANGGNGHKKDGGKKEGGIIAIGDVTGHGLNSGVLMMMVHATLRALSEIERKDLKTIYRVINKILYDFRIKTDDTRIMTLALLRYFGDGRFTLTGEHECILRIKTGPRTVHSTVAAGQARSVKSSDADTPGFEIIPVEYGMYAGLEPRISDEYLKIHEFDLAPGETIILYTDGITEAVDPEGVEFGQHGIINAACRAAKKRATDHELRDESDDEEARYICDAIMQAAREHTDRDESDILDDYSLVVIQRRLLN